MSTLLKKKKKKKLGGDFFFKKGEKYILFSEGNGAEYRPQKGPKKNPVHSQLNFTIHDIFCFVKFKRT